MLIQMVLYIHRKLSLRSKTYLMLLMNFFLIISHQAYPMDPNLQKECLLKAYPGAIILNGELIKTVSGKTLIWDDGKDKSFNEMMNTPDLQDTLSLTYPAFRDIKVHPLHNEDPGRFRYEPLMKLVYGNTAAQVQDNLSPINWLSYSKNRRVQFNKQNGAAQALKQIIKELEQLPTSYHKYLTNIGGTFRDRKIAGTHRLSPHAFGIAIDLNVDYGDYWQYVDSGTSAIPYKNRMPQAIVDIFERHCFIWGGRWYHYDSMHFEYRPEFFCGRC
jgi:hypothetical protein